MSPACDATWRSMASVWHSYTGVITASSPFLSVSCGQSIRAVCDGTLSLPGLPAPPPILITSDLSGPTEDAHSQRGEKVLP